jgi:hypothetical protein
MFVQRRLGGKARFGKSAVLKISKIYILGSRETSCECIVINSWNKP